MVNAIDLTPEVEDDLYARGRVDPGWWFQTVLGDEPWSEQLAVAEAVRDHREVAVKSCNGAGKSWGAARIALWFLFTHFPSVIITTAPTDRQVKYILWHEIRSAHVGALMPLGGSPLLEELQLEAGWYGLGFAAPDYDPTRFQGFHSPNVLVVVDEAAGVTEPVFEGVDAVLSGGNSKLLQIGNPTDPTSHFAQSFKTPGVHKRTIRAWDTPNFREFGITEDHIADGSWQEMIGDKPLPAPHLVTPEWVATRYRRWGPHNPVYQARVRADFPEQATDALISLAWVERAQRANLEPGEPNRLGVDVARMGTNETVIYHRRGHVVRLVHSAYKQDTMQTVGNVVAQLRSTKAELAQVDADGIGAGVCDRLAEKKHPVVEIHGGHRPRDTEQFANARAEWFWTLRERFEADEIDLDPEDEELAAQLVSLKWKLNSKGQVLIESKEEMERRGLPSPDRADGVAYAFAQPGRMPGDYGVTV